MLGNYEFLVKKLKEEGSFSQYYRYLQKTYQPQTGGSHYSLQINNCNLPAEDEAFLTYALGQDLAHKSLTKLEWIAEAEKEFTPYPYFTALDRYYRINPDVLADKDSVQHAVRELEHIFKGKSNLFRIEPIE